MVNDFEARSVARVSKHFSHVHVVLSLEKLEMLYVKFNKILARLYPSNTNVSLDPGLCR